MSDTIYLLNKFEQLASKYAPDVIESSINAQRISSINDLFHGVIGLVALVAIYKITTKIAKKNYNEYDDTNFILIYFVGVIIAIVPFMTLLSLMDIWTWVGLFNPKLAIAHSLMGI